MTQRHEIEQAFSRLGSELVSYWPFFGAWSSNSQYGYEMSWHSDKAEAEASTIAYYSERMNLIRQ